MGDDHREVARRLQLAAATGELLDLLPGAAGTDRSTYTAVGTDTYSVRGEDLVDVLTIPTRSGIAPRAVRLRGARITGTVDLDAVTLPCPLVFVGCTFEQPLNLSGVSAPTIKLFGCQVPRVVATHVQIRDDLVFDGSTLGETNLRNAHIGGLLTFIGTKLSNPGGFALFGNNMNIERSMFCRDGFVAEGEVRVRGTRIGGQFDLGGAVLRNQGGSALDCAQLTVGDDMFCRRGFVAEGGVSLYGAKIGGNLNFHAATLANPDAVALDLRRSSTAVLRLTPSAKPDGILDVTNARVGELHDDPDTWPDVIRLRGFKYDTLGNDTVGTRKRLEWVGRHPDGYAPGMYDTLADSYRRDGEVGAARQVAITKHWLRRRKLALPGKAWNWLLYLTVGYGYRTWLAGLWLLGLLALGAAGFALAHPAHIHEAKTSGASPEFQPVAYAADVLVPIVDLGQQTAWQPQGAAQIGSWVLTGAGWVLTTAIVAGMTNALKRDP